MPKKKTFYITTPIYYPSGKPHIGTIYTTIVSDIIARWKKLEGYEVFFTTGTDENAQSVLKSAKKAKLPPKKYVDKIAGYFEEAFKKYNLNYDKFVRTTDPVHKKYCQNLVQTLFDKGDIYKGKYEGWYCTSCETYYTEKELNDGNCPLHGTKAEWMEEESYFFKMSKYQKKVEDYIKKNNYIIPKSRQGFILNRMKEGVKDLCISRTNTDWGIKVPFDKKHVLWVWFDALPNYISSTATHNKKKFWPADVHIIAHDILWHHSVIWLSMLIAAGIKLPKKLLVHGFINAEGGVKMSKSLGNVVDPLELVKIYPADTIRYFLIREIPFGNDGNFSMKALRSRHNNELANDLGNLLQRTTVMIEKYFDGKVPVKTKDELSKKLNFKKIEKYMESYDISNALAEIWKFVNACNKYINDKKPWELAKKNKAKLQVVIYNLAEALRIIAILLKAFMPETASKIGKQLGFKNFEKQNLKDLSFGKIKHNKIPKPEILFNKIEEEKNMAKETKVLPPCPACEKLSFKDWEKLKLKIGKVVKVEQHPNADKLYVLLVNFGKVLEERQLVAGISKYYKMEELMGKNVVVVTNLQPAVIRGVESNGMLLAAEDEEGTVRLLTTDGKINAGAKVE